VFGSYGGPVIFLEQGEPVFALIVTAAGAFLPLPFYAAAFRLGVLTDRGDLDSAAASLDAARGLPWVGEGGRLLREAATRLLVEQGRPSEALDELSAPVDYPPVDNPAWSPWRGLMARASAALGRTDEAVALAREEVARLRRWGAPTALGPSLRVLGEVRGAAGTAELREAVEVLSRSEYVGADREVIANSMTGTFEFEKGDIRDLPDFNVFFRYHATYPFYSHAVWFLTQMRRWGQIPEEKPDSWYGEVARRVYRPDIYRQAAELLVAEGHLDASEIPETDGYKPPDDGFIDGVVFDARKPNEYLSQFAVGLQGKSVRAAADGPSNASVR